MVLCINLQSLGTTQLNLNQNVKYEMWSDCFFQSMRHSHPSLQLRKTLRFGPRATVISRGGGSPEVWPRTWAVGPASCPGSWLHTSRKWLVWTSVRVSWRWPGPGRGAPMLRTGETNGVCVCVCSVSVCGWGTWSFFVLLFRNVLRTVLQSTDCTLYLHCTEFSLLTDVPYLV